MCCWSVCNFMAPLVVPMLCNGWVLLGAWVSVISFCRAKDSKGFRTKRHVCIEVFFIRSMSTGAGSTLHKTDVQEVKSALHERDLNPFNHVFHERLIQLSASHWHTVGRIQPANRNHGTSGPLRLKLNHLEADPQGSVSTASLYPDCTRLQDWEERKLQPLEPNFGIFGGHWGHCRCRWGPSLPSQGQDPLESFGTQPFSHLARPPCDGYNASESKVLKVENVDFGDHYSHYVWYQ